MDPEFKTNRRAVKVKSLPPVALIVSAKVISPSPPLPPAVVIVTLLALRAFSRVVVLRMAEPSVPVVLKLGDPVIS